jgi:hypothetical protein
MSTSATAPMQIAASRSMSDGMGLADATDMPRLVGSAAAVLRGHVGWWLMAKPVWAPRVFPRTETPASPSTNRHTTPHTLQCAWRISPKPVDNAAAFPQFLGMGSGRSCHSLRGPAAMPTGVGAPFRPTSHERSQRSVPRLPSVGPERGRLYGASHCQLPPVMWLQPLGKRR